MKSIPLFKVFMPAEVDAPLLETLHSGYLAEGPRVREFSETVRTFLGAQYAIPVSSCTMALTVSYDAAGISAGDEVISTPLTCVATNTPLLHLGARIVWADCEPRTGMIDPKSLEKIITKKTKAIVVLHKDGDLAKMDEILAIAKAHNLKVIEDAAHTFGAKYKGRNVGTFGDFTCFSLQAIKQVTTGDGGIVTCTNEDDYRRAKALKWFGLDKEMIPAGTNPWLQDISLVGYKANMNDIAATIGLVQMRHADDILARHHRNGKLYNELLAGIPGIQLIEREVDNFETYWTYAILAEKRDAVRSALMAEGIAAMEVHPRNDTYSIFAASRRELPGVDYFSARQLSLPCGWWVEDDDIRRIVNIIKRSA
jgi:dTDP-4-amino-4,6-dideoxygalactose transaminase